MTRFVVMSGIYTVASFKSYEAARTFARNYPDPTRIVERKVTHRKERAA